MNRFRVNPDLSPLASGSKSTGRSESSKVKLDLNRFKAATSRVDLKPYVSRLCQSINRTEKWVGGFSPELMTNEDRRDFFLFFNFKMKYMSNSN
ncbi:hypothetical protein Hanom_Chr01g00051301 [Helianthus anomalus]